MTAKKTARLHDGEELLNGGGHQPVPSSALTMALAPRL